ncbi:MAG: hypothetical protein AAF514_04415, partial [Verrucomicrobiota bacterium]
MSFLSWIIQPSGRWLILCLPLIPIAAGGLLWKTLRPHWTPSDSGLHIATPEKKLRLSPYTPDP